MTGGVVSSEELEKIDRLIAGKPDLPPERIYGWMDSQLSIARHYGGITYQGHQYVVDFNVKNAPLVRADVLAREAREAVEKRKSDAAAFAARQEGLF